LLAAAVLATFAAPAGEAFAQAREPWPVWRRGDGYTYYERRRTKRPEHGFEGFAGPPMRSSYCSYQRIPNRTCTAKGCRVTGWTLEQYCQ
jgi:hypothetical protein